MNARRPPRDRPDPARPRRDLAGVAPITAADEGGETACWAHLVCEVCGALSCTEHRPDRDRDAAER